MATLDTLLRHQALGVAVSPNDAARFEATLKPEASTAPRSWQADARKLVGVTLVLPMLVLTVLLVSGNTSADLVLGRLATVVPLLALGSLGAWWAVAPRSTRAQLVVAGFAVVAMTAVVALRGAGHVSATPEWVCTANHLGLGLVPLGVAALTLRRMAHSVTRSLVAGLAVGTVGAVVGEVGCDQAWQHVLAFHLTPWVAVTVGAVLISRGLRRLSFAP